MRVLIADDDETIRAMLGDVLADLGHAVTAARDGREAVELAVREPPDVAILDFLMPRLSGVDALRALRERGVAVPVVLLTAIGQDSMREVDGVEEAAAVLGKPFRRRDIERVLERVARTGA